MKKQAAQLKTRRRAPTAGPVRARRFIHLLLLLVAAVIVVDTLFGERGLLAMLRARKEYDALAMTVSRERAENAQLREQARRLREDPAAIEELARRELGLIRRGEKLFIIKDVSPSGQTGQPAKPLQAPAPERQR